MEENNYNINKKLIFLAKSEIRLKILTELKEKPQTLNEIVKKTNITYSSVSSNLNKLEFNKHVIKDNKTYELTPMTKIYINHLIEFKKSMDIIKNFNNFWNKHNIDYINNESIENINDLYESKLIETNPTDIYKTHNTVKNQLIDSKSLKAILPYVHPEYPKLLEQILINDGNIELILNKTIYKGLLGNIDKKTKHDSIKKGNLNVHILNKDLNIYLAICDDTMNLGLFKNDGSYDQNRILSSKNKKSLNWANELFETIKIEAI